MRFQTEIEQKPLTLQRKFSQNVTFFIGGTSSKAEFLLIIWKRTKGEISNRNCSKTPYDIAIIFT